MTSPEGRWWKARQNLGDELGKGHDLARRNENASAHSAEIIDLAHQSGQTEAVLELARVNLDLALLKDRRARAAHENANEVARRRGATPDTLSPYVTDPSLAVAQAEFHSAQREYHRVEQALQEKRR